MRVLTENHPYMILSRALQSRTEDGPCSAERNGLNTAIPISKGASDETTYQGAEVVNGDLQRSATPESAADHQFTIPPCSSVSSMNGPFAVMWPNFMVSW